MEWWLALNLVYLVVLCLVYIPVGGYWIFNLHKHHERSFYRRREHPVLTGVSMIVSHISSVFSSMLPFVTEDQNTLEGKIIHTGSSIFFNASIVLIFYTIGSQAWFVYYKSNLDKVLSQHKWTSMVDTSLLSKHKFETNWFVAHNKTVGNRMYVKKYYGVYCLLWYVLTSSCSLVVFWSEFDIVLGVSATGVAIVALIPVPSLYIYIVRHTADFKDVYRIFHQARMHSRLLLIKCITTAALAALITFVGAFTDAHVVVWMWLAPATVDMYIIYYSTMWIIDQNDSSVAMQQGLRGQRAMSTTGTTGAIQIFSGHTVTSALDPHTHGNYGPHGHHGHHGHHLSSREASPVSSRAPSVDNDRARQFTLKDALADRQMFTLFVKHLDKEFASENMAFLVESQQFAKAILLFSQSNGLVSPSEIVETSSDRFVRLPQDVVPTSTIVSDASISLHEKATLIYKKYIEVGSEYAINISSKDRNQLTNSIIKNTDFSKEPESTLLTLFSACEFEVLRMFLPSFIRFTQTDEYTEALGSQYF